MKQALTTFLFFIFFNVTLLAQDQSTKIVGIWEPSSGKARVKIDQIDDKFYGRIVWLREPNDESGNAKKDKNNPDEALRVKPLLGYRMLRDFTFVEKNTWDNGTIYDPESGSTYSCTITMTDDNTLEVRGYIGVSLFGRTDVWKRLTVKKK
jgi:uncharacterized protein (DUF2147 family)